MYTAVVHEAAAAVATDIDCILPGVSLAGRMVAERAVDVIREMVRQGLELLCLLLGPHRLPVQVNQAEPTHFVYISIDGVAPRAKMNQQRTRRYMAGTAWQKYLDLSRRRLEGGQTHRHTPDQPLYESNAITPGTEFMLAMQERLAELFGSRAEEHKYTAWGQVTLVLSTTASAGEGEHKIMNILRTLAPLPPSAAWECLHSTIHDEHVGDAAQFFPGAADVSVHLASAADAGAQVAPEPSPVHMMVYGNDADWMPLLLGVTNTALLRAAHVAEGALSSSLVTLPQPGVQCSILRPASKDAMFRSGVLKKGDNKNKFGKKRRRNKCEDVGKVVGAHAEHAVKAAGPAGKDSATSAGAEQLPPGVASGIYEVIPLNELWLELGVWMLNTALKCEKAQWKWLEQQSEAGGTGPPPYTPLPMWVSATKVKAFRRELGGGATLPGAVAGTVSSSLLWLACRAVDDFVCLLTMVGNDFLPAIPGVSMRHNVRSVLLRDRGLGLDAVVEGYLSRVLLPAVQASGQAATQQDWVFDGRSLPVLLFDRELVGRDCVRQECGGAALHLKLLAVQRSGLSLGAIVRLAASESVLHAEHGSLLTAVDGVVDAMQGGMRKPVQAAQAKQPAAATSSGGAASNVIAASAESGTFDPYDLAASVFDQDGSESDDSEDQRAMAEAHMTVHELTRGSSDDLVHAADTLARMDKAAPTQDVLMHPSDLCPSTGTGRVAFSQVKLDHYFNKMGFQFEPPTGAEPPASRTKGGVFGPGCQVLQPFVSPEVLSSYPAHSDELVELVKDWLTGLVFVLRYYFSGVPSWQWFYPHHYSPFASDIAALAALAAMPQAPAASTMDTFDDTDDYPVAPLTQLLAVVPPASWHLLPAWVQLALAKKAVTFPSPTSTLQGMELAATQLWAVPPSYGAASLSPAEQERMQSLAGVGITRWTPEMADVHVDEEDAHKDYEVIVRLPFIPVRTLLDANGAIQGTK